MNCEWVKGNAVLFVYHELADGDRIELQQHIERCADCAREVDELRGLQTTMSARPQREPEASLLAASRMKLSEALETAEQAGWWRRALDVSGWMRQVRFAPALAMMLLMIGFGTGVFVTWKIRGPVGPGPSIPGSIQPTAESSLAGIRAIQTTPSGKVEIQFDKLMPDSVQGNVDDPKIQQLLVYSSQYKYNPGVRLDSIDVMAQSPDQEWARGALMYALRYDSNPGVRLKALDALRGWVGRDLRVRNAVIEAVLNDSNQGVRTEALRELEAVKGDSSVRDALQQLATKESNSYLRGEAQRILGSMPQME